MAGRPPRAISSESGDAVRSRAYGFRPYVNIKTCVL